MLSEDIWATTLHQSSPFSIPSKAHYPTTFLCGSYHPLSSATPARPCKISDQWQTWLWQQRQQWSVEQRMSARTMCCFGKIERRHGHSWCTRYYLIIMFDIWCASCPSWICSHSLHLNEASVQEQRMKSMDSPQVGGLNLKHSKTLFFFKLSIFDDSSLSAQARHPNVQAQLHGKYLERHLPVRPLLLQCKVATGTQCKVAMWYLPLCPCRAHSKSRCHSKGWTHRTCHLQPLRQSPAMSFHRLLPDHPTLCHLLSYKLHHPHKCGCSHKPSMCSNKNSTEATLPHNQHNGFSSISRFWQVMQWDVKDSVMKPWWLQRQPDRRWRSDLPWPAMIFLLWPTTTTNHRCSLSCDPCDQIVTYSAKLCEHASHILPVPLVFHGFSSLLFASTCFNHLDYRTLELHLKAWYRKKGRKCIGFCLHGAL